MPRKLPEIADTDSTEKMSENNDETNSDLDESIESAVDNLDVDNSQILEKEKEEKEEKIEKDENKRRCEEEQRRKEELRMREWNQMTQQNREVLDQMRKQEFKMGELMKSVTKLCQLSIQSIDQLAETTNLMKQQLISFQEERKNGKSIETIINMVRDDYLLNDFKMSKIIYSMTELQKQVYSDYNQDEATRKQTMSTETKDVRAVNYAKKESVRCYKCQSSGHIASNCPNKSKGILCYKCNRFGDHIATSCPYDPTPSTSYGSRGRGNLRNKQFNNNYDVQKRAHKRRANEQPPLIAKRSRFSPRGRSGRSRSGFSNFGNNYNYNKQNLQNKQKGKDKP
ncbi:zinc finger CCHC domain-containing protein 7-like [Leptopilina heterotoma]|uniref:zinc finger CCHC domain-containing protein 7-like n=1 Tax=Leptopilina heterotoma TaxID=63436 RepID=UPI001CA8A7E2|nr:zinc finger CCHC domain-containing protein 7-like [Leptopilina heterotoma]